MRTLTARGSAFCLAMSLSANACVSLKEDSVPRGLDDAGPDAVAPEQQVDVAWSRWNIPTYFPDPSTMSSKDGVVYDTHTGLAWIPATSPNPLSWAEASTFCEGERAGGFSDWRVPMRIEVASVVDYRQLASAFAIALGNGPSKGSYWTGSEYASDTSRAWNADVAQGRFLDAPKTDLAWVRCVRIFSPKTVPSPRFVATSDGIVIDRVTNLQWTKTAGAAQNFQAASIACTARTVGGLANWRLPTLQELLTLVDERRLGPAIDPSFGTAKLDLAWSTSGPLENPLGLNPDYLLGVDFSYGYIVSRSKAEDKGEARCVR